MDHAQGELRDRFPFINGWQAMSVVGTSYAHSREAALDTGINSQLPAWNCQTL